MLFNPFEKQFHLPATPINLCYGQGRQRQCPFSCWSRKRPRL